MAVTPRSMIMRAIARQAKAPRVTNPLIPPPVNRNVPADQLYNFSDVGGIKDDPRRMKLPPQDDIGRGPGGAGGTVPTAPTGDVMNTNPADRMPSQQPQQPVVQGSAPAMPSGGMATANMSAEESLRAAIAKRNQYAETEVKDDDSKLTNFYQGARMGARHAARQGTDLEYTVGATIGGALRGLFHPKEYEEQKKARKLAEMDAGIENTTKQYQAELAVQAKKQDIADKQVEQMLKLDKHQMDKFNNALKFVQDFGLPEGQGDPLRQAIKERYGVNLENYDPNSKSFQTIYQDDGRLLRWNPTTGRLEPTGTRVQREASVTTTTTESGTPVTISQGALYAGEAQITSGNAQREHQVNMANANNQIRVMSDNASKHLQYQSQLSSLMGQMFSDPSIASDAAATGLRKEFENRQIELENLRANPPVDEYGNTDDNKAKAYAAQINQLTEAQRETAAKLWTEVGKTEAGKARSAQIQEALNKLTPPPAATFTPEKPVKANVGGRYTGHTFANPGALKQAFPGKSEQEIRQIVEANGGKFQR